jgi:tRNA pseudouridine55 synthase
MGKITAESEIVPTEAELDAVLAKYQGTIMQTPPMHSAKKINGKRLYTLAR